MKLFLALVAAVVFFFAFKLLSTIIDSIAEKKSVPESRVFYLKRFVLTLLSFIAVVAILLIFSIDFSGLFVLASSLFAVVGVALFAQWSILSNATASVVIFFNFPARVGDCIKIVDADNTIQAQIVEISLFHTRLKDIEGNSVIYPNNLILQKAVIKVPKLTPKDSELKQEQE